MIQARRTGDRTTGVGLQRLTRPELFTAAGVVITMGIAAALDLMPTQEVNLQIAYVLPVLIAALQFRTRTVLGVAVVAIALDFVDMVPWTEEATSLVYSTITFLVVCFVAVLVPEQRLRASAAEKRAQRTAEYSRRLQHVTAVLAEARTLPEVTALIIDQALAALDAQAGSVIQLVQGGSTFEVLYHHGYIAEPDDASKMDATWRRFPMTASSPASDAVRTGQPVILANNQERASLYPHLSTTQGFLGDGSAVTLPLLVDGQGIGAIHLSFDRSRHLDADDRDFMLAVARQCALALDRERLFDAEARLAAIAASSSDAIYAVSLEGTIMTWNEGAERLYGYPAGAMADKHLKLILPEDRADEFDRLIKRVARGELLTDFETVCKRRDGQQIDISASIAPLRDTASRVIGVSIIARDITERKRQEYARQLLAEAGSALSTSLEYETALDRLVHVVVPNIGDWCAAYLVEEERFLRPVAVASAQPASELARRHSRRSFARRPMPAIGSAVGDALRSGHPVEITNVGQNDATLAFFELGIGDLHWVLPPLQGVVVPMVARGRLIGALVFAREPGHLPGRLDLRTAEELARRAALAVDNGLLFEAERHARNEAEAVQQRLRFLSEASRALNASLDYHAALSTLAKLAIPHVADWCQFFVYGDDGGIRRLASAHVDPSKLALLHLLDARFPINPQFPDGTPLTTQSRQAQLIGEFTDDLLIAVAQDPEHLRVLRVLGPKSLIVVPLTSRGRVLGSMMFVISESDRRFSEADFSLAEQLAQRAANAIDRAQLFRAEQAARKQAEAAVKVREEFIAVAAHELNTPLTNLRGYAQLEMLRIRRKGEVDTRTVQRALTVIDQQSTRLANLVSRLFDATVLDLDQVDLDRANTNLGALVEDIVLQYQSLLIHHRIVLNVVPDVRASLDVGRFEAVLTNLLENAVRFSLDGGTIRVDVSCPTAGTVRLSVADDGPGIPLERRSQLFERFYQADRENNRSGLGLGLYVSQKIVALHGGELNAEFPLEGGTRFVVTLPTLTDQSEKTDEIKAPEGTRPAYH